MVYDKVNKAQPVEVLTGLETHPRAQDRGGSGNLPMGTGQGRLWEPTGTRQGRLWEPTGTGQGRLWPSPTVWEASPDITGLNPVPRTIHIHHQPRIDRLSAILNTLFIGAAAIQKSRALRGRVQKTQDVRLQDDAHA